jgi:hypothetical protein
MRMAEIASTQQSTFAAGRNSSSLPAMEIALEREETPISRILGVARAVALALLLPVLCLIPAVVVETAAKVRTETIMVAASRGTVRDPYTPTMVAQCVGALVLAVLLV